MRLNFHAYWRDANCTLLSSHSSTCFSATACCLNGGSSLPTLYWRMPPQSNKGICSGKLGSVAAYWLLITAAGIGVTRDYAEATMLTRPAQEVAEP